MKSNPAAVIVGLAIFGFVGFIIISTIIEETAPTNKTPITDDSYRVDVACA